MSSSPGTTKLPPELSSVELLRGVGNNQMRKMFFFWSEFHNSTEKT